MRRDSIAWLCCWCSHSLLSCTHVIALSLLLFPFFAVYLPHKCTFAIPFLQLSWKAAEFSLVKCLTLLFQLIIHLVLWKPLHWLPSQERKTRRVSHVSNWTVLVEKKYRNNLHTHVLHHPYVYSHHGGGSEGCLILGIHSCCIQRHFTGVWGLFQLLVPAGDI